MVYYHHCVLDGLRQNQCPVQVFVVHQAGQLADWLFKLVANQAVLTQQSRST